MENIFMVPAYLAKALHLFDQFICMWDLLHKGGTVDNHNHEGSNFSWLVEIMTILREIFSTFNWVKSCKYFLYICKGLITDMKKLTNFQMARFANSAHFVFVNSCSMANISESNSK